MTYLRQEKNPEYVLLSLAFAFLGSLCAINICDQFRLSLREKSKFLSRQALAILMAMSIGTICT
jgi:hypothetical protein